jgi:hypothetical protein
VDFASQDHLSPVKLIDPSLRAAELPDDLFIGTASHVDESSYSALDCLLDNPDAVSCNIPDDYAHE